MDQEDQLHLEQKRPLMEGDLSSGEEYCSVSSDDYKAFRPPDTRKADRDAFKRTDTDMADVQLTPHEASRGVSPLEASRGVNSTSVRKYRLGITSVLILCHIAGGLQGGLRGVTMLDILEQMSNDTTMEHLAVSQSAQSFGHILGSIVVGPLVDRTHNMAYIYLACSLWITAIMEFLKPWCKNLQVFGLVCFFDGTGQTGENLCVNSILLSIWGKSGDSSMQVLHAGWMLGFAVAPLLAAPFLSQREKSGDLNSTDATVNLTLSHNITADHIHNTDRFVLWVPFAIVSLFALFIGIFAFVCHYVKAPKDMVTHRKPQKDWKSVFKPGSCAEGNTTFGALIVSFLGVFYFVLVSRHTATSLFLVPLAVESKLAFDKQSAAVLGAVTGFAFVGGRIIAGVTANWVSVQPMVMVEIIISGLAMIGLATFGMTSAIWLWTLAITFNMFEGPLWPGLYSWGDKYIVLSGVVITVIDLTAGVSGILTQWATGHIYTHYSPEAILTYSAIWAGVLFVVFVTMQIVASRHGTRKFTSHDEITLVNVSNMSDSEENEEFNDS